MRGFGASGGDVDEARVLPCLVQAEPWPCAALHLAGGLILSPVFRMVHGASHTACPVLLCIG